MQNLKSFKKERLRASSKHSRAARAASQRGYLLIELMVAITIFSIVVVIAVGSFVNALRTQRQVAALSGAESNLDVALEQMAREIRTGSLFCVMADGITFDPACGCSVHYDAQNNIVETCSAITFTDADGNNVEYSLDTSSTLEKSVNGTAQEVTGSNVKVQYFNSILFGNTPGDHWNPRITITLGIHPNDASLSGNVLNLETTVSARQIDCTQSSPPSC